MPHSEPPKHFIHLEDHINESRRAFDAAAPVYDATYEDLYGIKRARRLISTVYHEHFPAESHLLELNCGTGTDALMLAQRGSRILATDLSAEMIGELQRKASSAGLQDRVEGRALSFHELETLKGTLFDGAYSNMGGLNCVDRFEDIANVLHALIRPGGHFIATVMPDFCLWETMAFLVRLEWHQAFRRLSTSGTDARFHGGTVRTFYFSPKKFVAPFLPFFEVESIRGLNFLTPPPNSPAAYATFPALMRLLENVEQRLATMFPFTRIGDQYVVVLRRKHVG